MTIFFCVSILLPKCLLIVQLPEEALLHHVLEAPGLHEWFDGATEIGNPDALLLALKVREKIAGECAVFGKLLPNPFSPNKLFAADNLSSLASCLKVLLGLCAIYLSECYMLYINFKM